MALTNALLKSMGIENDQRDQIMAAHKEVCDSIIAERDEARDTAARVPDLEKRIQELEAREPAEDFRPKYDELKAEYEEYKSRVEAERAEEEKARLYRSLLREQGVDERRIDSIMRVTDLGGVAVKDGVIQDAEALAEAIASEWGDFIVREATKGAEVDNPPSGTGAGRTRDEIMAIEDTGERQAAIADNIELFQ